MEFWDNISSNGGVTINSSAVCRLFDTTGSSDCSALADAILNLVNPLVEMANCSVMAFTAEKTVSVLSIATDIQEHKLIKPALHEASHLFQHDRTQLHLQSLLPQKKTGEIVVHRQPWTQILDIELKHLYKAMDVIDSIVITIKHSAQEWLSTTLYRTPVQGALSQDNIYSLLQIAPLVATAVMHQSYLGTSTKTCGHDSLSNDIDNLCPRLTKRERQVILAILDGITVDQIAGNLGLKPTTISTYRSRGYEKLGVSSRQELFSTVLRNQSATNQSQYFTNLKQNRYATGTNTHRPHQ
jgi:DNA-binding NarL/FixJ family response regulator